MSFTELTTLKQIELFTHSALLLENGAAMVPITVGYEEYGELNSKGDNCILIEHALTGTTHVAQHHPQDIKGWWDYLIGPNKLIDTNKYYVICSNVFGGYSGTTGPSSINPHTQQPYRLSFPGFSMRDIINVQKALLDQLGVKRLVSVIGGSLGGMQATQWAIDYPDFVASAINIASPLAIGPDAIGYNLIQRMAILNDPNFDNGNYKDQPHGGLATARMVGMMTYRTSELFAKRFERFTIEQNSPAAFSHEYFEIESYLRHQGNSFVERFDANSYLYLTKVMDLFDVTKTSVNGKADYQKIRIPYLIIAICSDQLFRINDLRHARDLLQQAKINFSYHEVDSEFGHDAFLIESEQQKFIKPIAEFLCQSSK